MIKCKSVKLWMGGLALLGAASAHADSMRCGNYLVNSGDTQSRVLEVCGAPQRAWDDGFIEEIVRDGVYQPPGGEPGQTHSKERRRVIPVYKWEYNFGAGTFLKILIFHSDTLVSIQNGPRQR